MVVDHSYRVVHLSEHAGRDITELARKELRFDIRAALHRVFTRNEPSLSGAIAVRINGATRRVFRTIKIASAIAMWRPGDRAAIRRRRSPSRAR
jgi:two-component system, chemotaxis family, CheB/CheR fusion protein